MINTRKLLQATAFMMASLSANATTFGPVENFDVVNDTGKTAHGFEIVLHGIHPADISSLFGDATRWTGMERYGIPVVSETSDANGPITVVTYKATYDGSAWSSGTPSGTLAAAPADSCWPLGDKSYGPAFPCDHFGVSTNIPATAVEYNWLLETGAPGQLTQQISSVPAPVWTVTPVPPVNNVPQAPKVVVQIKAPKIENNVEFGEPRWVKVTASGSPVNVEVGDLVGNNKVVQDAKKQVQVEWQLIQLDMQNPASGVIDLTGVQLDNNVKAVVYTFESYEYKGDFDPETHEALPRTSDTPKQPDQLDLGNFKAIQMAAINLDGNAPAPAPAPVAPTINAAISDAVINQFYSQVIDATPSVAGDVLALTITGLPDGLTFDGLKTISGTPTSITTAQITIQADDFTNGTTTSIVTPLNVNDSAIAFAPILPVGTVGNAYSYQLSATGGDGSFTYTTSPLPDGLSLSGDTIFGTPTLEGTTSINIDVSDNYGTTNSATTNLVINPAAAVPVSCSGTNEVITFVNPQPNGNLGWVDIVGGLAQGGKSVKFAPKAGTTFADGLVFGAFKAGQWLTYSGVLDADGFCIADTMAVSLQLSVPAPTFANGQVGSVYPATSIAPVGGWAPYTIVVSGLPSGLEYKGTVVSGTPTVSGTFPVTISVVDSKDNSYNITTASIVVNAASPIILGASTLPSTGTVGVAYAGQAKATGGVGTLLWQGTGLPTGVNISSAGVISGIPSTAKTFNAVLTVTDSIGQVATVNGSVVIATAPIDGGGASCTKPAGATGGLNSKGKITAINGNVITFKTSSGASVSVTVPACATIQWNGGAKAFALGQVFEWNGYNSAAIGNVAQKVTIN
jgi:hypothetical protein